MKISILPKDFLSNNKNTLKTFERIEFNKDEDIFVSKLLSSCDTTFPELDIFSYLCKEIAKFFSKLNISKTCKLKQAEYNILCGIKYGSMKYNPVFYKLLSDDAIQIARRETNYERIVAKENIYSTIELKNHFDKKYGKAQYSIACIGRSPSMLTRCFDLLGVDTKYCPITNLWASDQCAENIMKQHGIENYINYLKKQGISKENIDKSNKKVLFIDYTTTKKSLNLFSEMMKKGLQLPVDKTEFIGLNDLMLNITDNYLKTKSYIDNYFEMSEAHRFGGVPKLYWNHLGNIYKAKLDQVAYISYNRFLFATQDIIEQAKKRYSQ